MNGTELHTAPQEHGIDVTSFAVVLRRDEEEIYGLLVSAREAVERWVTLRALADETGFWPVLGWGARWIDESPEYRSRVQRDATAEILADSEQVDPGARVFSF